MKKRILKILSVLFALGACVCLYFAFQIFRDYEDGKEKYEDVKETYTTEEPASDEPFSIDWNALLAANPDVVGWIRMDTGADYPVVQGDDNSYYLRRDLSRSYNINGSIFMHCDNSPDWSDKNTIVYGHRMNNGTMFGNNLLYKEKKYAQQHPYFYIYVPDGFYTYQICHVMQVKDGTEPYELNLGTPEMFQVYLDDMEKLQMYDLGVPVTSDDQLVTLSTCTVDRAHRFIIQGKLTAFTDNNGNTVTVDELLSGGQAAVESEY
uniref:class B sortase n=1 Tax=Lachnoclostridium phocaeense TaxID=1871021 RepID=UPI0026DA9A88|nr:class B sortase [Lachnoclostridium phocaeense]